MGGVTLRLECNFDHPVPMLLQQQSSSASELTGVGFISDFNTKFDRVEGRKMFLSGSINGPRVTNRVLPATSQTTTPDAEQVPPEQVQYARCSALFYNRTSTDEELKSGEEALQFPPDITESRAENLDVWLAFYDQIISDYNDQLMG
jgi:hypothetical protein